MKDEPLMQFREHALAALKSIPDTRWYAMDETALDSLAYFGIAWQEERANKGENFEQQAFADVVGQIVSLTPSLLQERPEQPKALPEVWKDAITGETPRNPWAKPADLRSQMAVAKHDPELAEHLKKIAKGVSYAVLAQQREKEAARSRMAAISYGEEEHRTNPFVGNGNLTARGQLVRQNPELAEFYNKESRPVRIAWQPGKRNLTEEGILATKAPHLAKVAHRAAEMQRQFLTEKVAVAKESEASAQQTRQQAEALLR